MIKLTNSGDTEFYDDTDEDLFNELHSFHMQIQKARPVTASIQYSVFSIDENELYSPVPLLSLTDKKKLPKLRKA